MLTKVRQLCSNQKLTANCYQKLTANCYQKLTANCYKMLTANCYQKLTAKCYQKFQSKVDSEMLSKVSVKSRHQKFQSKVDNESFSQKLTAKCNAKIVREMALRYCKQINNQWRIQNATWGGGGSRGGYGRGVPSRWWGFEKI